MIMGGYKNEYIVVARWIETDELHVEIVTTSDIDARLRGYNDTYWQVIGYADTSVDIPMHRLMSSAPRPVKMGDLNG